LTSKSKRFRFHYYQGDEVHLNKLSGDGVPLKIAQFELMTPTAQINAAVGVLDPTDEPAARRVFLLLRKKFDP
jgi:hypothetical protein